MKIDNTSI